jgi:hypothetical protein
MGPEAAMAKRTNRVAWGLVWGLAVVMIGSVVVVADLNSQLPEESKWVILLPRGEWGFGPDPLTVMRIIMAKRISRRYAWHHRYKVGFLSLRID